MGTTLEQAPGHPQDSAFTPSCSAPATAATALRAQAFGRSKCLSDQAKMALSTEKCRLYYNDYLQRFT